MRNRRHVPPLNALLAFDAVARNGSFVRASEELRVAQPAVTRHIGNLENWLGVLLFDRRGNSTVITKDGQNLADLTVAMFDRLEVGLRDIGPATDTEVVIGASFGIAHLWVIPRIAGMRHAAGGVAINFVTSEDYAEFERQHVDLSIRFGDGHWPGRQADLLFEEQAYVIASPDFLAKNPSLNPDDLAGTMDPDWLIEHGDRYNAGWMTWDRWYVSHGQVPPPASRRPEISNYPTVLDMVRCGEGVAIGSAGLDDALVSSGDVLRLGPPLSRAGFGYYLTYARRALDRKSVCDMRNYLVGQTLPSNQITG